MRSNKASATAKVIAAATIYLDSHFAPRKLTSAQAKQWCQTFLSTNRFDLWLAKAAASNRWKTFWGKLEAITLPGIIEHYARRKKTIEVNTRELLTSQNITTVYVLGAGFDTLALRLSREFPSVKFIEIDHPATQSVKQASLKQTNQINHRLEFQAIDLSTDNLDNLFDPSDTQRLVIAEGLFMYFQQARVQQMVRTALTSTLNQSHYLIFTYMNQTDQLAAGFRPTSQLIDLWLRFKGEPFLWSTNQANLYRLIDDSEGVVLRLIDSQAFENGSIDLSKAQVNLSGENLGIVRSK